MDPIALSLVLFAAAVALLVGELLLPTHGVLGVLGLLCLAGAVGVVIYVNLWLGLGALVALIAAAPFAWGIGLKIWERSPIGRRIILQPADAPRMVIPVKLGQSGTAVSELRPMGECGFGDLWLEAISDAGVIRAGARGKVVVVNNGLPTVREATA